MPTNEPTLHRTCRDCGAPFDIAPRHAQWFDRQQFRLPRRCPACRQSRRVTPETGGAA